MMSRVLTTLDRERAGGFAAFGGSHVVATVPITQHLVDVLVAHASATRNLSGLQVTLRANQEIGVRIVKSVLGFDTRLAIDLRIRGPVDLATDPRLYLVVARPSLTWSALSRVVIAAGLAPPGVEIGRDGVAIDLRAIASRAGVADLLPLVQSLAFESDAGLLRVQAVVDVPEGGTMVDRPEGPPGESSVRAAQPGGGMPAPDVLLKELRGARVRGRIAIGEDLANEALGIALAAARAEQPVAPSPAVAESAVRRSPVAAADPATVARWIQQARVQFENGQIVLEHDVVIG